MEDPSENPSVIFERIDRYYSSDTTKEDFGDFGGTMSFDSQYRLVFA